MCPVCKVENGHFEEKVAKVRESGQALRYKVYMANTPLLAPEQWEALKLLSVKGIPDKELAERFGVNTNAIAARRFDDPVWKAAFASTRGALPDKVNESNDSSNSKLELAQKVASSVSENITRLGEQNRLLALQIAGKGLKQANAAPPDVQSWQDVKALMDIVAKASGMDQAQAVQVNVLSSQPVEFRPHFEPVVETEVEQI